MDEKQNRKIIHIDMDCFYAAVEMRDDPSLINIPIAVGGSANHRGVLTTCNYPAREYGCRSAMATAYALKLCPQLKILPVRMSYYREVSVKIREILSRYTDLIEPVSLDEAYLDVSDSTLHHGSATLIAKDIREAIYNELNLTASAGVAPAKFVAKIASDENKPNGQLVVPPGEVLNFLAGMPLQKIPGVGKVTIRKLNNAGLNTCQDVRAKGHQEIIRQFGANFGDFLWRRSNGIDHRGITTSWVRKSLSVERTFNKDIGSVQDAASALDELFAELTRRLKNQSHRIVKNQQVKLKFADFHQTTMERSAGGLPKADEIKAQLFHELLPLAWERGLGKGIRLLGLGVNFYDEEELPAQQLTLF